jgi:dolichyl-diphosphooligosaccharide--protein glycosyltransferase
MRKRLFGLALLGVLGLAAVVRFVGPWHEVFGGDGVNFLETDAWEHVRLVESQARNFPHAITFDPYASPSGRVVAVAPLFDAVVATAVVLTGGRHAPAEHVARVAAVAPAVLGVLAVLVVALLGATLFGRRAGWLAGAVAAVAPGPFLERTLLGYVDHHALEALLSLATLAAFAWALRPGARLRRAGLVGLLLGLYLLTWSSGTYLVAILGAWLVVGAWVGGAKDAARVTAVAAAVALVLVPSLQDRHLDRYGTQVAALAALLATSLLVARLADRRRLLFAVLGALALVAALGLATVGRDVARQLVIDLARFRASARRMDVVEARPLFLLDGTWRWSAPWTLFGPTFFLGLAGLAAAAVEIRRSRRLEPLLVVVFVAVGYAATFGQNRFGYYLVPGAAVLIGGLAARAAWRTFAVVALLALAPSVGPAFAAAASRRGMPRPWADAMASLRATTPEPFDDPDFYFARYDERAPVARNTVMNWWDQGYWVVQAAHRVPVSDPTQDGAGTAASFYLETDEARAMGALKAVRARHVLVDWELPFRPSRPGELGGRFQALLDWAGLPAARAYELCFARRGGTGPWEPIWIFREAYYRSMAYRLMVLGGRAVEPVNHTWVVGLARRRDADGKDFCEVTSAHVHASAEAARAAAGPGLEVVGLTPLEPAFPTPALEGLREVGAFKQGGQGPPLVRVFEVAP